MADVTELDATAVVHELLAAAGSRLFHESANDSACSPRMRTRADR
jgi:hypothetical protein